MSASLIFNHGLSFAVVMLCWWLSHQCASRQGILGRVAAVSYGVLAVITIAAAIFRQFSIDTEWLAVLYKSAVLALFFCHARLLYRAGLLEHQ